MALDWYMHKRSSLKADELRYVGKQLSKDVHRKVAREEQKYEILSLEWMSS